MPDTLPEQPKILWERRLTNQGLGGIAATREVIVVVDRDAADRTDIFRCLDAGSGEERWVIRYPAPGNLDYGNSPRATPLIVEDRVYLFGAFGHLTCAHLETGEVLWRRDLRREFAVTEQLVWGFAGSPLLVDDKLIVQPGGPKASIVALDPKTGATIWQMPGDPAAFSSPIVAELGGRRQIVGYDKTSLGGWDVKTGRRLWQLMPPKRDDFNVPTPIAMHGRLLVSTENNGTRSYQFQGDGVIVSTPVAKFDDLAPDTHSPVVVDNRLFGIWNGDFYCLDATTLKPLFVENAEDLTDYSSIVASEDRLLIVTQYADVLLVDTHADQWECVSRWKLFADESGLFSHPAIVGNRFFIRVSDRIACVALD